MTTIDHNKNVIEKIKEIRIKKNISQTHIAKHLQLSVSNYNRLENNKIQLTINNLYAIAEALQVGVEMLLSLSLTNSAKNYNSLVMSNFNNGELHLTISAEELKKQLESKK